MIKLIIFAVLGLTVGLGGGSAMSVMKAKTAFAAFEAAKAKIVADSIATAAEHGLASGAADSSSTPVGDSATAHVATAHDTTPPPSAAPAAAKGAVDAPAAPATHEAVAPAVVATPDHAAAKPAETHEPAKVPAKYNRAVATVESHGTQAPSAKPRTVKLPPKPIAVALTPTAASAKLAKIFGAMPPKDAAKVLEQMVDVEVQSILGGLSDKQAASVLQNLPAARAAAISKALLKNPTGGHDA